MSIFERLILCLYKKMMIFDEFIQIYKEVLQELVDSANALFHMDAGSNNWFRVKTEVVNSLE